MLADPKCSIVLTLAGSTSAGGCMQVYADMVKFGIDRKSTRLNSSHCTVLV
jgi:deoxyhypusine synthase